MSPALLLALFALSADADAEPDFEYQVSSPPDYTPMGLGLGVVIGAPTGFTGAWRAGRSAIDGALAWDIPNNRLHLHSDYLFTVYTLNDPLLPDFPGNPDISDPNRWQPLALEFFFDQGGNPIPG